LNLIYLFVVLDGDDGYVLLAVLNLLDLICDYGFKSEAFS